VWKLPRHAGLEPDVLARSKAALLLLVVLVALALIATTTVKARSAPFVLVS
jgi:hypothetical protein